MLSLGIVGAGASLFISMLKTKYGTDGNKTKVVTLAVSLLFAAGFVYLENTPYLEAVYNVLAVATMVYAFIIKE